jgi:hypothetical protein
MHSRASLATEGMSSVKLACVDPNLRLICDERNDPKASDASSGTVIKGNSLSKELLPVDSSSRPRSRRGISSLVLLPIHDCAVSPIQFKLSGGCRGRPSGCVETYHNGRNITLGLVPTSVIFLRYPYSLAHSFDRARSGPHWRVSWRSENKLGVSFG